jgi:hypothetical protein
VASLAELNQRIAAADIADGRVITSRPVTIAAAFAAEQPAMLPGTPDPPAQPRRDTGRRDRRPQRFSSACTSGHPDQADRPRRARST